MFPEIGRDLLNKPRPHFPEEYGAGGTFARAMSSRVQCLPSRLAWPINELYFKSPELDQYRPKCNAARDPLKPKLGHRQKSRSNMT
jgi:hypothetical protein